MALVKIEILKVPSITVDGVQITFPFKRVDALFYYMLCKKSASRRELIDLLWENCDEEVGYKNLRHTLYTLKKSLGFEAIISPQKSVLQINEEIELLCDYDEFMGNYKSDVYKGSFLQGFAVKNANNFDCWMEQERESLQSRYLRGLSVMAQESLEKGESAVAEKYAADYLREDPLDEHMTVFLMQLYRDTQVYHKASKVYQRFKKNIADELGITPLNETTALYYEIMNQWNSTVTEPDESVQSDIPSSRAQIMKTMKQELKEYLSSTGKKCSMLLWGETGVGKTYILSSFLNDAETSRAFIAAGECYQTSSDTPFSPWNSIMISIAELIYNNSIRIPEEVCLALADIFPVFSPSNTCKNYIQPRKCSPANIDALTMLFSILARYKKVIIIIEDIHWINSASLEILDCLLRRLGGSQIMVVASVRDFMPSFTKQFFDTAVEDKIISKIDINCLTLEDTKTFLQYELGEDIGAHLIKRVFEETSGNPLLLQELVKSINKNGSLEQLSVGTTHSVMSQRLVGLSVQARQMVDIISLFPDYAPCELLSGITDKSTVELLNIYEELKGRSLVEEQTVQEQSVIAFTHPRMREVVYNEQSYFKRRPLHLRVARLIERQSKETTADNCRRLIYHFTQGGDELGAFQYKILGLELFSCANYQYPALLAGNTDAAMPKDFNPSHYISELNQTLCLLRRKNDDPILLDHLEGILLCVKARWGIHSGDYDLALKALNKILSDPTLQLDTYLCLCAYRLMAVYCGQTYDLANMERRISAGFKLAEKCDDVVEKTRFMLLRGLYFSYLGEFDKSIYYINEAMDIFLSFPNAKKYRMFIVASYHYLGEIKRKQKDFAGACSEFKMAVSVLNDVSFDNGKAALYTDYGRAAFALGDHSKAKTLFKTACELYEKTNELSNKTVAYSYFAYYKAIDGDYKTAVEYLTLANQYAAISQNAQENGICLWVMASLRQRLDMAHCHENELDEYLDRPLTIYCKRGINFLEKVPFAYEIEKLNECLYYDKNKARPYTTRELYSQNKHFMTE